MSGFIRYRIAFVPDEDLANSAVNLAAKLASLGETFFRIDDVEFFSHITIYDAEYPLDQRNKIFEIVDTFSQNQERARLIFSKFYSEWGWVGLDFDRTADLELVHRDALKLLNPLRSGHVSAKHLDDLKTDRYSEEQKKNIINYDYPLALSEYHPHLTLTRYRDSNSGDKIRDNYNKMNLQFPAGYTNQIAITTGGEHGTVSEFVKRFDLKK